MTLRLEGPHRFVLEASDSTVRSIASALSASASGCVSRRSSSESAPASGCVSRRSSSSSEGLRIGDGDMMLVKEYENEK